MKFKAKILIYVVVCLCCNGLTAGENLVAKINSKSMKLPFKPMLVKVEANYDQFQPDEILWLTCWWQNTGTEPAEKPLSGFTELSFGHQRIAETATQYHRSYWEPYPATNQWNPGEVWKTMVRCNLNVGWGGTYTITIGLCDENHLPVNIIGEKGSLVKQVQVGKVDVAWGWGTPSIERMRRSWVKEFNIMKPVATPKQIEESSLISIGKVPEIKLLNSVPVIFSIGEIQNDRSSIDIKPTLVIREYALDQLIYSNSPDVKVQYSIKGLLNNSVVYHGIVHRKKLKLAEFDLRFESVGHQLQILLSEVKELQGFELLEIKLPSLLSFGGDDVSMVSFFGGGRLISLKESAPEGYTFNYDVRNAAALIKTKDQLVLESTCLDDKLIEAIYENDKTRMANLGIIMVNKVRGKNKMSSIPVENDHKITIELLDNSWGKAGWQSVAKYLRNDLVGKNRELYKRVLFYKALATSGPEPPEGRVKPDSPYGIKRLANVIKFKKISDQIREMSNILDDMPQVCYVIGFQEGGFDNSNPFVYNTDQRAGTIDDLRNCLSEGRKYNATVGLHDNYDDMALTKYYDKRIVSIDDEGNPWKGWIWAGGLSHNIAPNKYSQSGLMQERVKKTIELYGLKTSYHLDVLSSEPLRYDFDPSNPASADKSLKGKLAIIDEFNKYNIDITSESLTHPFVGHIGHALWPREDKNTILFKGDRNIPLVPFVYHGTIGYCGTANNEQDILINLIRGGKYIPSEEGITDNDIMNIYIQHIPVELFYDKKMESIENEDETTKVVYDNKSYIKVNFKDKTYEVYCDGELIAKDWTTFAPGFKEGTYLAFSKNGGNFDYPVPSIFSTGKKLHAVTLTRAGEGNSLPCQVVDGHVVLDMPKGIPVRITSEY